MYYDVTAGDDPLFQMNAYTSYLASKRGDAEVIWSRIYDDAFGLGKVVTASKPIYSPETSLGEDGGLVGVVGHDVRLDDFEAAAPNFLDAVRRFIARGVQCIDVEFGSCDLQVWHTLFSSVLFCGFPSSFCKCAIIVCSSRPSLHLLTSA